MGDRIGQQFGNYRLVRQLGRGGFAEVYLGEHLHLAGRLVAVKLIHASGESFQDFLGEAQIIANLKHPNIVEVLDFGIEASTNTPYLIMSYAPHGTLRDRYPRGTRLLLDEIILLLRPIAQALFYAHQQGLVHRDVKPENMLIDEKNNIVLSDFGIAVVSQSVHAVQMEGGGTPAYMAPEQIKGEARAASDQYALGIVAYQWLCGSTPFSGPTPMNYMMQHMTQPPPPLCEQVPGLSRESEAVILRTLSKDYRQRFSNVIEFIDTLAATSSGTTTTVRRQLPPNIVPAVKPKPTTTLTGTAPNLTHTPSRSRSIDNTSGTFTLPPDSSSGRQVNTPRTFSYPQNTTSHNAYGASKSTLPPWPQQGPSWHNQPGQGPPYHPTYNGPQRIDYGPAYQPSPRRTSGCTVATLVTLAILVVVVIPVSIVGAMFWGGLNFFNHIKNSTLPTITSTIPTVPTINTSIPTNQDPKDILSSFCFDIQSGNYQGAYDEYSSRLKTQVTVADFTAQWTGKHPSPCVGSITSTSGQQALGTISMVDFFSQVQTNYQVTLIIDGNAGWKIDSINQN